MVDTARIAELSEAFYPATVEGQAKRLWDIGPEISTLKREQDNLRTILGEHCHKNGEVIVVEGQPDLRWTVVSYDARGREVFGLRFDRKVR